VQIYWEVRRRQDTGRRWYLLFCSRPQLTSGDPYHTKLIPLAYNEPLSCTEGGLGTVRCNIMIKSIFFNTFTEEGTNNGLCLDPTTVRCCIQALPSLLALKSVERRLLMCWMKTISKNLSTLTQQCNCLPLSFCTFPCRILVHLCLELRSHLIPFHSHHVDNSLHLSSPSFKRRIWKQNRTRKNVV
jgi:hypothetical protein